MNLYQPVSKALYRNHKIMIHSKAKNSRSVQSVCRNFSHSSYGSCGCLFCSNIVSKSLQSTMRESQFQSPSQPIKGNQNMFHTSTVQNSSMILRNPSSMVFHTKPRDMKLSEHLIQKRAFTFSSAEDDDAHHIENLLQNNKNWVKHMKEDNPEEYKRLGIAQTPKYLYFGCSDSRVPANQILGLGPGEVFVHRNVGNLVPGNDLNALSVLEFAVGHLGVTDIIVTGHYNCGAVKAAVTRQDLGMLENWLRLIRDVYRLHRDYLDRIVDDDERHKKLVELNVVEQCINIFKTGIVQRKRIQNRASGDVGVSAVPRIHGLVFDTAVGLLHRLNVDYSRVGSLDSIYGLYPKTF